MLASLLALFLAGTSVAHAQDRDPGSPFDLSWGDAPAIGLGVAGTLAAFVQVAPPSCLPDCDRDDINALDRLVAGNFDDTAHTIADFTVLSLLAAPIIVDAFSSELDGFAEDMLVYAETILAAQAIVQLTKFAVDRPAPFVYGSDAPASELDSPDASRSFVSGHTTMSFAAMTAMTVTFWLRHPRSPMRFVLLALGATLATTVGALKIIAGYHYPTDILAGALVGISTGLLVPLLHTSF